MILNIDTSTDQASVCLSKDGVVLQTLLNDNQKDHAAWIQQAISTLMSSQGAVMKHLEAVSVTEGPGSYTGLRVGMASAKGLCFALQIPLITVNTLLVMANGALMQWLSLPDFAGSEVLLCPMIDARRMEVFTGVYNQQLQAVIEPQALILEQDTFKEVLNDSLLLCFGNGSMKWKNVSSHPNVRFMDEKIDMAKSLAKLATGLWFKKNFANMVYTEPVYLKEFYSYIKK
jgi:tRNA threonylcarbamoyladenosine biosynthesis protein TsaB